MLHAESAVAAARPTGGLPPRPVPAFRARFGAPVAAIALPALIALGLCCYQLATPNVLLGVYDGDDGVYFGAALRLAEGSLPYRDFIIVHPPGIAVLLLPLAGLAHFIGSRDAMALARILTSLVTTANVVLVGLIVRHRGAFTTFAACIFLACFPVAVAADNTLLLEPYLAFFSLLGVLALYDGDGLASPRRVILGGFAFGFAVSVKIWAAFPILLLGIYLLWRHRSLLWRFAAGAVGGFLVLSGPFLVAAPSAFFRDVVISQWLRGRRGPSSASLGLRLLDLTGLAGLNTHLSATVGLVAGAALASAIAMFFLFARPRPPLEFGVLACAVAAAVAEFISREFYAYYSYFPAVFLAPLCGLALGAIVEQVCVLLQRRDPKTLTLGLQRGVWAMAGIATVVVLAFNVGFARRYLASSGVNSPAAEIDRYVPQGACVLSVDAVYAIMSNRFSAGSATCPALDDSYGTWIALSGGRTPASPPYSAALVKTWTTWLEDANYLIYRQTNVKIPWTNSLLSWFDHHYRLIASAPYYQVWVNLDAPAGT